MLPVVILPADVPAVIPTSVFAFLYMLEPDGSPQRCRSKSLQYSALKEIVIVLEGLNAAPLLFQYERGMGTS